MPRGQLQNATLYEWVSQRLQYQIHFSLDCISPPESTWHPPALCYTLLIHLFQGWHGLFLSFARTFPLLCAHLRAICCGWLISASLPRALLPPVTGAATASPFSMKKEMWFIENRQPTSVWILSVQYSGYQTVQGILRWNGPGWNPKDIPGAILVILT